MIKIKNLWFKLKFGVQPHKHVWIRIAANTWACSYSEKICEDPPVENQCSAWCGEQAWS